MTVLKHPSPNFGPRRHGGLPDMVVLHHTAMTSAPAAIERLCDPAAEVSAHYVIALDGAVTRLVDETARAWHAGAGRWGNVTDVNSHSIGIELDNAGPLNAAPPFPQPQMAALDALLAEVLSRWSIAPERVIAHSDMAPLRKSDPGPAFDWQRLARQGLSVWPGMGLPGEFLVDANLFGYDIDFGLEAVLTAFRMRFRPGASGPLSDTDRALMRDLAHRFPVDRTIGTA